VKVARLTRNNRDALAPQVYGWLRESLGLLPPGEGAKKKKEAAAAAAQLRVKIELQSKDSANTIIYA